MNDAPLIAHATQTVAETLRADKRLTKECRLVRRPVPILLDQRTPDRAV